jgi:septal ring factor EnvC (AmiA/AmiB activator)
VPTTELRELNEEPVLMEQEVGKTAACETRESEITPAAADYKESEPRCIGASGQKADAHRTVQCSEKFPTGKESETRIYHLHEELQKKDVTIKNQKKQLSLLESENREIKTELARMRESVEEKNREIADLQQRIAQNCGLEEKTRTLQ